MRKKVKLDRILFLIKHNRSSNILDKASASNREVGAFFSLGNEASI